MKLGHHEFRYDSVNYTDINKSLIKYKNSPLPLLAAITIILLLRQVAEVADVANLALICASK